MDNVIEGLDCDQHLKTAIRYSLINNGKLFRPLLLLTYVDQPDLYFDVAMAIECIHTYSLVHDDLPCMDNDDYRRGKLTNHRVYGEDIALLVGDSLLTLSFELISKTPTLSAEIKVKLITILTTASGVNRGMINGQVLDITNQTNTLDTLITMELEKTGALLTACLLMANTICPRNDEELLVSLGSLVGLYYQMYDDYLDTYSDFATIGKPVGSDHANGKDTFCTYFSQDVLEEHLCELSQRIKTLIDHLHVGHEFKTLIYTIIDWGKSESN